MMTYKLSDLIEVAELQRIMEDFSDATGIVTALLEMDGTILIAAGWQDICVKFHRINPETACRCTESDTALASRLKKGEKFNTYKCLNGLLDVAVPVIIEGEHLGNFFTGQFLFEPPDKEFFRELAATNGFDEAAYMEALEKVPIVSEDYIKKIMNFLVGLTTLIGKMGLVSKRQSKLDRIQTEMELARSIQTSLLPTLKEGFHPDFQIAASMIPADQVGGDFYDITYDRNGCLWLSVGDVSGHGVTPGLIMMMAQTAHTTITTNIDCEARDVVVMVNEILYKNVHERLNESHFMTFTALKYLGEGRFQHSGAHLSLILFRKETGTSELIRTRGIYLNFKKDISKGTKNSEFQMAPGDLLILYTDGLTEAENGQGEMLDIGGFVKIVEKHANQKTEAMKNMILADVIQWCNDIRVDDMTLVIIKRKED